MSDCDHMNFRGFVNVGRILKDNEELSPEAIPIVYLVNVSVICEDCGHDLLFQRLPMGLDMNGYAMSADQKEARLTAQVDAH